MNGDVDVVGVAVLDSGGNVALSWLIWTFDLSIKIFGEEIVHTRTHTGCFNIDGWLDESKEDEKMYTKHNKGWSI